MEDLEFLCKNASFVKNEVGMLDSDTKDHVLCDAADALLEYEEEILKANALDVEKARANHMAEGMVDRLTLNHERIEGMADGLRQVARLEDPIGEVLSMKKRPNGLIIGKRRVPLGVIGIIYEARPNVTSDAFALCFKTGNCVILKGGSDAILSNIAIVKALKTALVKNGVTEFALNLIESTDRETTMQFMKMHQYVDLLIPRGGHGLIRNVVENATIPVIETGTGNCHIYVDSDADLWMAVNIINNAKTQRISVCNACESIVVHRKIAEEFLPMLYDTLAPKHVQFRGDRKAVEYLGGESELVKYATEEDWGTEYLDYILSVKIVDTINQAICHINRYTTHHSESIITNNYDRSQLFLDAIDSACVYVNASTRFTDGNEFGFGAEIGISTQKLHARGPMGLEALTSYKYIIYGNGQIRE
jgi:glutamate-5-semialdehyde dehydrogenase